MLNDLISTNLQRNEKFWCKAVRIVIAFSVSVAFIWLVGYFFCNSLTYYKYDSKLKRYVHAPGTIHKHRSEGIAITHYGRFNIQGISDITKIRKDKIIVWGDSFVEAHQVDDQFKIPQQITRQLANRGFGEKVMAFGVGMSGDSVADYCYYIPKYEELIQNIIAHYIVITNPNDTLPDQSSDNTRWIFKSAPFRLTLYKFHPEFQGIKKKLNQFGLYFIWQPVRSTIASLKRLQMRPQPSKRTSSKSSCENEESNTFRIEAWTFLFEELKEQTSLPLIFVYCPHVPRISNGKIITADSKTKEMDLFFKIARQHGISVINLRDRFVNFYKTSGVFPRGFPNSIPGEGHLNQFGDELVAEAIADHLISKGIF